jgi:cyclopropane-fatty-acyl-phospholipid synthase
VNNGFHEKPVEHIGAAASKTSCDCIGTASSGERIGPEHSAVQLIFRSPKAVAALLDGQIGSIGSAIVEGWVEVKGSSRDIMAAAAGLLRGDPVSHTPSWLGQTVSKARSLAMHTLTRDAEQIQFHYDLSDDFYALWLDPRRVYSCAYYKEQGMSLAQAQEAKLDHICKSSSSSLESASGTSAPAGAG